MLFILRILCLYVRIRDIKKIQKSSNLSQPQPQPQPQPQQDYFTEQELWYMLYSLSKAGFFFQNECIYHGDFRTEMVFICPQGYVKIGDHGLTNHHPNNFTKAVVLQEPGYLSPILMKALKDNINEPIHNQFKSDVWSLGLTVLGAATLISPLTVYDYDNNIIRFDQLQDLLVRIQQRYSNQLLQTFKMMFEKEEDVRPDFQQLFQIIDFQQNIQIASKLNSSQFKIYRVERQTPISPQQTNEEYHESYPQSIHQFSPSQPPMSSYQTSPYKAMNTSQNLMQSPYSTSPLKNNLIAYSPVRMEPIIQPFFSPYLEKIQMPVSQSLNINIQSKPGFQKSDTQKSIIKKKDIDNLINQSKKKYPNKSLKK